MKIIKNRIAKIKNRQIQRAMNYDLFNIEKITPPAPATIDSIIKTDFEKHRLNRISLSVSDSVVKSENQLPESLELYKMFDNFNWQYFEGKLPKVKIEYSKRMLAAGSYTPSNKLIKLGIKYHLVFPDEIADTLKHEMIHIIHYHHNSAFKAEARRIGASLNAKFHPSLKKAPKYLYLCQTCQTEYPRQKILRMASCGKCSVSRKYDKKYKLVLSKK